MPLENTIARKRGNILVLGAAAAATVALVALAFPPAELSLLAWVAFVPLLLALRSDIGRWGWLLLWVAGLVLGSILFIWMRHVIWFGAVLVVLLGFYLSLYFLAFCFCVRSFSVRRKVPFVVSAPLIWTALEVIRGTFLSGLPWALLAHTQYGNLAVIQIAEFTGAAGVTFWLLAVNGLLADVVRVVWRPAAGRRLLRPAISVAAVAVLSAAALWWGSHRMATLDVRTGPSIAVIQGNVPQDVKNRLEEADVERIFAEHLALTDAALEGAPAPGVDLVIWPETMAPLGLFVTEYDARYRQVAQMLAQRGRMDRARKLRAQLSRDERRRGELRNRQQQASLLIGAGRYILEDEGEYVLNSVYLLPKGETGPGKPYDKIHLVPFGEYVPLKPLLGWIVGPIVPYKNGQLAGTEQSLFEVNGWRFAPTICFEDGFPGLVADFGRGEQKMDFIVNVTNEGWFKDGSELDLHLAIGVFRAVECRAGFVRAANTGISAFISPTGEVLSKLEVGGKDREVSGVLLGHATTAADASVYLTVGETFGIACVIAWAAVVVLFAVPAARLRWRRRSDRKDRAKA